MHLAESNFGPSVLVPVMLEGPKAELDKQGPALVKALAARRDTRVLSAWDVGDTGASLRPDATHAMLVASVAQTEEAMVDGVQQEINRIVDDEISGAVTPYITGTPTIDLATKDQSLDTARRAELLALPILFLVLLIILRAPVAALVLTAFGGVTTLMSFGAMALLGKAIDVDATAVAVASMAGLALGVSYAMLVYRRWRTERGAVDAHDRAGEAIAASRAVETSGRAVLIGGTALVVTLALAPLIGPDTILISIGIGAMLCAALAIGGAVVVMPAVMTILGRRLQAFSFSFPALRDGAVERARESRRRLGHPQRDRRRRGGDRAARGPRPPDREPGDRADLARAAAEGRFGPRGLRQDLRGDGPGLRDAVQHRRGLQGRADHRPRHAARARCLPGGDRRRLPRGVRRRPG